MFRIDFVKFYHETLTVCSSFTISKKFITTRTQPDMLGDLTHVVRLNWQDWAGHSSYVVK